MPLFSDASGLSACDVTAPALKVIRISQIIHLRVAPVKTIPLSSRLFGQWKDRWQIRFEGLDRIAYHAIKSPNET